MIDTDKYEGHMKGPWTVFIDDDSDETYLQIEGPTHTIAYDVGRGLDEREGPNIQTAHVIADAPLLLAEVIRLRSHIAHHVGDEYRQCPECGSIDFFFKFDDEGMECKCDKCDNIWRVKIE